ncbi:type II toxin-antitoxin system prevent-host-death family antitoxin [Psychrobacter sp. APC 3426]|uniref:type II toxin-antitoxin system Phd/YefM family antitoxin n=1 Tax=Psychrobacter sp. APC 3426 TaxID=3035177 RepID=UPI0025B46E58|nr:type II toxin-antitoxin system prevent-host-death family antitoxin [Psychrobacter sp. APC 3426]MDN3399314.1 type II toxin-antitoxin system prevent-host-death family antitoxin [Psychrobacter sp. APC 3426]
MEVISFDADVVVINRKNNNDAVVMSHNHYNSLMETLYLLGTPANAAHLAKSIKQYRSKSRISD